MYAKLVFLKKENTNIIFNPSLKHIIYYAVTWAILRAKTILILTQYTKHALITVLDIKYPVS